MNRVDGIILSIGEDGIAREYDDTYDITIHCESREEQEECSDIWHRADSAIASALEIGLRVKKLPSAQQDNRSNRR